MTLKEAELNALNYLSMVIARLIAILGVVKNFLEREREGGLQ
jgi:hypothetical protein